MKKFLAMLLAALLALGCVGAFAQGAPLSITGDNYRTAYTMLSTYALQGVTVNWNEAGTEDGYTVYKATGTMRLESGVVHELPVVTMLVDGNDIIQSLRMEDTMAFLNSSEDASDTGYVIGTMAGVFVFSVRMAEVDCNLNAVADEISDVFDKVSAMLLETLDLNKMFSMKEGDRLGGTAVIGSHMVDGAWYIKTTNGNVSGLDLLITVTPA